MGMVNEKLKFDPDFGDQMIPDIDMIAEIDVTPSEEKASKWKFFLFIPKVSNEEELKYFIMYSCECLLAKGDSFNASSIDIEDIDENKLKMVPVASFDPDYPLDVFWLTPPKSMWN